MKRLTDLFLLLLFTVISVAAARQSKQQVFLNLTDASGQMIRGTSTQRGYERQVIVTSFSGVTTGNPQVQFIMPSGSATATLANLQGNKNQLSHAVFTTTQTAEQGLTVLNTVRLEEVTIIKTEDINGSTTVTLKANRIGTTYYQNNLKTGVRSISGKTGWDFVNKKQWTAF
jgi:type VI protein secretion system component Hcp